MIKKLWNKFKEYFLYLLFGGLTTVVNYAVYIPLASWLKMDVLIANAIAWVAAVAFAYITNRKWVFESKNTGLKAILKEIGEFVLGRLITLGLEELILFVFVDILGLNEIIFKLVASVVTIIVNYIFSKFIIFKKEKNGGENMELDRMKESLPRP